MHLLHRSIALAALLVTPAAVGAAVTPDNVARLAPKWTVTGGAVTGGAILRDGRLYVGGWDSRVYALDPTTGAEIWSRPVNGLVSGRVHVLDDGGVCYGTIVAGEVGCLDGATGAVRWQKNLSDPLAGQVWSAPAAANGRLFVGIAGLTDNPCSRGRLVALDLATGNELWRYYTVPDKVCTTDTSIVCTVNADCPDDIVVEGECVQGLGAGVTATPLPDPTGEFVYMNTVGCYTFPSIGQSDTIFKFNASTGLPVWDNRVSAPEQFGACVQDTSIDCGVDADCESVGGTCVDKAAYHDFGFLNGPIRVEVPDGAGTKPLIVSASKNGTIYAFDEVTGNIAWQNVVRIEPVTPAFAGFGLFNGAINYADGRVFAALNALAPARVCSNDARKQCSRDDQCPGGTCPPEPKHLMAFDATTGATLWAEEIGRSYSHVGVANGIVYAGTRTEDDETGASSLFAHDAVTGARLATLPLPGSSTARAVVDENSVYIGFGEGGGGGVMAFSLCANQEIDDGEECDHGPTGSACCTAACKLQPVGYGCDDADACTGGDACNAGTCAGSITSLEQVRCKLGAFEKACGEATLPKALVRTIDRAVARIARLFAKADTLADSGKADRAERLRQQAMKSVQTIGTKAGKAAKARKESKRISAECHAAIDALVASRLAVLQAFSF